MKPAECYIIISNHRIEYPCSSDKKNSCILVIFISSELIKIGSNGFFRSGYQLLSKRNGKFDQKLAVIKHKSAWIWLIHSIYGEYQMELLHKSFLPLQLVKNERTVVALKRNSYTKDYHCELEVEDNEDLPFIMALIAAVRGLQFAMYDIRQ